LEDAGIHDLFGGVVNKLLSPRSDTISPNKTNKEDSSVPKRKPQKKLLKMEMDILLFIRANLNILGRVSHGADPLSSVAV